MDSSVHLSLSFEMYSPTKIRSPNQYPMYIPIWPIEAKFRPTPWMIWFEKNWTWSIYLSFFYITVIFGIQRYMNKRPAFKLRQPLLFWNLSLAIFSILGTIRTAPELIHLMFHSQDPVWYTSLCTREYRSFTYGFWALLFTVSKAVELGDTFYIVSRKQPLIFLHWYHHITVLCYCWATYSAYDSTGTWFIVMNFAVHSCMYSYYALKIMKVRIPKFAAMSITLLQLSQMVVGMGCNIFALTMKLAQNSCDTEWNHIFLALAMYFSYFVLFVNFFCQTYFKKPKIN